MPQCICGRSYSYVVHPIGDEYLDMCPSCVAASTPQSYVNKEWVGQDVVETMGGNGESRLDYD